MIDVTIPQEWIDRCEQFSLACAQTNISRYRSRGQMSIDKIVSDIYVGKMGECAVYLYKTSLGETCSEPDFMIYRGRKKSYAADLICGDYKIHVKTQSLNSATKYGTSWILQCKDGDQDKLFKFREETDTAALCVMKSEDVVTILAFLTINYLFDNDLIEEPKIKFFKGIKKALYWENILEKIKDSKYCKRCNIFQFKERYYARATECKTCCKNRVKKTREERPSLRKNSDMLRTYGISGEEYNTMLKNQNYVCKICNLPETSKSGKSQKIKDLAVDHCHKTGKVRGLLCNCCNRHLGRYERYKEDIHKYLEAA